MTPATPRRRTGDRRRSSRAKPPAFVVVTGLSGAGKSHALRALEDLGYFCVDPDSRPGAIVINRSVGLRDTWGKQSNKD